jgi:adenine-specific DNA-methyltransferase
MYNVAQLGQVFTPPFIVSQMLQLRQNQGRILEPSAGDGSFFANLPNCVGIEIDPKHSKEGMLNMDFFDYPIAEKFDTIIGNPPYVRYQDIPASTKQKFKSALFDERSNLYLFFIEKCIKHLQQNGELIFITPRDFLKATSSVKLNKFIYEQGTITDIIDLGDSKVFNGFSPNCIIWRFEKNNFTRKTNTYKQFVLCNGQLMFTDNHYPILFSDIFAVKVGAVSGCDEIFTNPEHGNEDFVCSATYKTGETKRMIFNVLHESLIPQKQKLISRGIRPFNEKNWWQWGAFASSIKTSTHIRKCQNTQQSTLFYSPVFKLRWRYFGHFSAQYPSQCKNINRKTKLRKLARVGFCVRWALYVFATQPRKHLTTRLFCRRCTQIAATTYGI